jgi:hypothetical protein
MDNYLETNSYCYYFLDQRRLPSFIRKRNKHPDPKLGFPVLHDKVPTKKEPPLERVTEKQTTLTSFSHTNSAKLKNSTTRQLKRSSSVRRH